MEHVKGYAAQCLLDNGFSKLPIDITNIKLHSKLIHYTSYLEGLAALREMDLIDACNLYSAFTVQIKNGNYRIFYDEKLPQAKRQFILAHELGHIVLEHATVGRIIGRSDDPAKNSEQEKEADAFALYLLAQPCLLIRAGALTPQEISQLTGLPHEQANRIHAEIVCLKESDFTATEHNLCNVFTSLLSRQKLIK